MLRRSTGLLGVSLGREELVGRIAVVTMVGASFGTVAGMLFSQLYYDGVIRVQEASTGTLSGLVSITAACGCITVWQAAISAFVAGLLSCAAALALEAACIDDPVSVVAVHGVGGFWGLIVVGLFNMGRDFGPQNGDGNLKGLFVGGGWQQLGVQAYGGLAMMLWTTVATFTLVKVLDRLMGVRVPLKEELEGLDGLEHGICADSEKFLRARQRQMRRRWARRLRRVGLAKLAAAAEKGVPDEEAIHGPSICTGKLSSADTPTPGATPDPSVNSGDAYASHVRSGAAGATPDPSVASGDAYPSHVASTAPVDPMSPLAGAADATSQTRASASNPTPATTDASSLE